MLNTPDNAILVGVELPKKHSVNFIQSMQELSRLADTAGAEVVLELTQKREKPDIKFFIGTGKVEELKSLLSAHKADLVIFDNDLSPSQERNLEEFLGIQVIDRTELILNIFSQHARSREGKLQVDLAKLEFQLPRLSGMWEHLSRQRGGIGLRDVGEKQIELDRRILNKRISLLKKEIDKVRKERKTRRDRRKRSQIPIAAIVGYTNAGKSTLLNTLTAANVHTQDKLFATLDPTTKRLDLGNNHAILLTDTVGFIQNLPHQLVAAFSATLEEVTEADMLLHVVDASNPYFEDQIKAVLAVLEDLKADTKPIITVFNKIDKAKLKNQKILEEKYSPCVFISAMKNEGINQLLNLTSNCLSNQTQFFH